MFCDSKFSENEETLQGVRGSEILEDKFWLLCCAHSVGLLSGMELALMPSCLTPQPMGPDKAWQSAEACSAYHYISKAQLLPHFGANHSTKLEQAHSCIVAKAAMHLCYGGSSRCVNCQAPFVQSDPHPPWGDAVCCLPHEFWPVQAHAWMHVRICRCV